MLKKILLADSGTGQSEQMLSYLLDLPLIQNANITVMHVISGKSSAEDMDRRREEGANTLARTVQNLHLNERNILSVNTLLREGEPKDEVCKVADEIDAELIIMGSRGLKRLQSILENSVSQYVFQLSSKPMLLVKDDVFVKRIKRVMVALNPSGSSQASFELAVRLVRDIKGGRMVLAHINKDFDTRATLSAAEATKDKVLAPAIQKLKSYGIKYKCFVSNGKPGREICQIAEESNADLLVMGSPDRRPSVARSFVDVDRLLGNSVSDYVRVQTPCPVLFVRQGE